ncbi:MAG: glycoside hydrolase family 57 [Thermoleophilaceae bacterium]
MTSEREPTLLVVMFHMNLAFSSLEAGGRSDVIERCYRPMLELAERTPFPLSAEATGWTLEQIAEHDPGWIGEARRLIEAGRLELVGSGYAQCAAPLLPAEANSWNLRLGLAAYEELLGVRPRVALVSEQCYAPGLVPLYVDAGFEAIVVDWDNAYRSYPEWGTDVRRRPQRALGGGTSIPVIWSESIAFQKFQRFAHGEMELDEYVRFVEGSVSEGGGALMLYANDAEVFDHRPGRFKAEPKAREGEWDRIAEGLAALAPLGQPATVSDTLARIGEHELTLEAAAHPVPTKKQDKYNVSRWAVTGRDDVGINTRCWRIYDRLRGSDEAAEWRNLCELWASDYRTHITQSRWDAMQERLAETEQRLGIARPPRPQLPPFEPGGPAERLLHVSNGATSVVLNVRRGLALHELRFGEVVYAGTLEHGFFQTIELGADWYTANLVQEAPLRHKVTDLDWVEPVVEGRRVSGTVATELGPIDKVVTVGDGFVEIDVTLGWSEIPDGTLRACQITLHPDSFDRRSLWYATHDGGPGLTRHELAGEAFDHGGAVSALVSSRQGVGMTEGVLLMGDATRALRIDVDQAVSRPLALIQWHPTRESFFLRVALSLAETDETRRGPIPRELSDPQRIRVRLSPQEA